MNNPRERMYVANQIRYHGTAIQEYEKNVQEFSEMMSISAVFQAVGFQALFAAATMGAANWLGATAAFESFGVQAASRLGWAGRAIGTVGGYTTRGAMIAKGVAATELTAAQLTGVAARLTAGVGMTLARKVFGEMVDTVGTDKGVTSGFNADWVRSLGWSLALTVVLAWAGSPGRKVPIGPKLQGLRKVLHFGKDMAPNIPSIQAIAQFGMITSKGWNALDRKEVAVITKDMRSVGVEPRQKVIEAADEIGRAFHVWAKSRQETIAGAAEKAAKQVDYGAAMPFLARTFDFVGNQDAIREVCVQLSRHQAKFDFWCHCSYAYRDLHLAIDRANQSLVH